jgi:hypothetical protein
MGLRIRRTYVSKCLRIIWHVILYQSSAIVEAQLFKTRSNNNLLCPIALGFYLYSCGISRKVVDMLSRCGFCPCYESLHKAHKALARARMTEAQVIARMAHSTGWDNTQISTSVHVEQRVLTPPKVQIGTTSMIYHLRNTSIEDLALRPILEARNSAALITFKSDIRPTLTQMKELGYHLVLDLIEILTSNHPGFEDLKNSNDLQHKSYRPPPPKYKTQEYVLRTTTIEEGSTEGNIQVARNIYLEQLGFSARDLDNQAIPCINDQSTNARIRSAQFMRARDVSAIDRMSNFQLGIGFFHCQLNLLWAILHVHRGVVDDAGSLQFYISLLHKVRLGTENPDYHTLRSFTQQVLFGHILLYWETESGCSLDSLASSKPNPALLKDMAQKIFNKYI